MRRSRFARPWRRSRRARAGAHCCGAARRGDDFILTILPPLDLAQDGEGRCDIPASIRALNTVFEPVVLARLEEWYMLCELKLPRTEDPAGAVKVAGHAAAAGGG